MKGIRLSITSQLYWPILLRAEGQLLWTTTTSFSQESWDKKLCVCRCVLTFFPHGFCVTSNYSVEGKINNHEFVKAHSGRCPTRSLRFRSLGAICIICVHKINMNQVGKRERKIANNLAYLKQGCQKQTNNINNHAVRFGGAKQDFAAPTTVGH